MKIKPDGKARWTIIEPEDGAIVQEVSFLYPERKVDHPGGATTYEPSGPAKITVRARNRDGTVGTHSDVTIEWS